MKTNKELLELYEWLRPRNCWNGKLIENEDFFCELDEMPMGWKIAFGDQICEEIDKILKKNNYSDKYMILQIKEKYGRLHWYDNGVPINAQEEYDNIIEKYEKLSENICMICGESGKIDYSKYWLSPLCEKCSEKY